LPVRSSVHERRRAADRDGTRRARPQWLNLAPPHQNRTRRWFRALSGVQLSDFTDVAVAAFLAPQYGRHAESGNRRDAGSAHCPRQHRTLECPAPGAVESSGDQCVGDDRNVPGPGNLLQRGYGDSRDIARLLVSCCDGSRSTPRWHGQQPRSALDNALPSPFMLIRRSWWRAPAALTTG